MAVAESHVEVAVGLGAAFGPAVPMVLWGTILRRESCSASLARVSAGKAEPGFVRARDAAEAGTGPPCAGVYSALCPLRAPGSGLPRSHAAILRPLVPGTGATSHRARDGRRRPQPARGHPRRVKASPPPSHDLSPGPMCREGPGTRGLPWHARRGNAREGHCASPASIPRGAVARSPGLAELRVRG